MASLRPLPNSLTARPCRLSVRAQLKCPERGYITQLVHQPLPPGMAAMPSTGPASAVYHPHLSRSKAPRSTSK